MKFEKVIIDGVEYYRPLEEDSECKNEKKKSKATYKKDMIDGEIVKEDAEENDKGDDRIDLNEVNERLKRETREFFDGAKVFGKKIVDGAKDLGKKVKDGTERWFKNDKTLDPNSTDARLLRLLPYMDKKSTHELCEKLLRNDESLAALDIGTILPYLSDDDCDALFLKCIETNNKKLSFATATPYVSKRCLKTVVDGYIAGKYPTLDIDALYPFLSDADIKRIFYHILSSEEHT